MLPERFKQYLILGGNHRLRIFGNGLTSSYVILKKGESNKFITNEISLRSEFNLPYAPRLISTGSSWLQEEYIEGIPLNRLADSGKRETIRAQLLEIHNRQLITPSGFKLKTKDYLDEKLEKLEFLFSSKEINITKDIKKEIESTFKLLCDQFDPLGEVEVSWTHGDFQSGNVLVSGSSFKVIDWEASEKRFGLYDMFVLLGDIRSNGNLEKALELFEMKRQLLNIQNNTLPDWKPLIMLEELLFSIDEDCSINFYRSGENTLELCKQIKTICSA